MKLWRPSPPVVFSFMAIVSLILSALSCTGCAVDQGVEAELSRKLPDGTEVSGRFKRTWAGGPVELVADVDPVTGKFHVRWYSDVDLDPAARASAAQAEAQGKFLGDLSNVLRTVAAAAAGIPIAPRTTSTPSRAESGGMGPPAEEHAKPKPPKIELDPAALEDLDDGGGP